MRRLIHRLHVWLGVAAGLALLLLCLSGSLAVFRVEIGQWAAGGLPASEPGCQLDADQALHRLRGQLGDDPSPIRRLSLPALTGGHLELRLANGRRAQADVCGRPLSGLRTQVADFLVNLHTRLFLGKSGRWVVGLFGLLMLLSLASGLLAHRRILRQWFTLRRGRSLRLTGSDAHKLLGLWILPFHLLTAASGAWLGLASLLPVPVIKGVKAAAQAPYERPLGLQAMLDQAGERLPGLQPVFFDFFPERGQVSLRGNLPGELVQRYSAELLFDGQRGDLLGVHDPRRLRGLAWWNQAMMPLHLGDWAGVSLRWLYALLGLGSAALIWLGLWLWGDRRRHVAGALLPRGRWAGLGLRGASAALLASLLLPWLLWRWAGRGFELGASAWLWSAAAGMLVFVVVGRFRGARVR